jgi:diamine N-acetyltransferase
MDQAVTGVVRFAPLNPSPELAGWLAERLVAMDPWRRLGFLQDELEHFYLNPSPGAERYLLRSADGILGVLCLQYPWLRGVYVEQLAVFPPHQGQGIGRQALEYVEHSFAPRTRNLWLLVSGFNQAAQGFYRHLGFSEVGRVPDLLMVGEEEILLRKPLG